MRLALLTSLFFLQSCLVFGQERAHASNFPLSVERPKQWESFPGSPKNSGEVLFLQSPKDTELDATVSISAYPLPNSWDDLVRRENFLMLVHDSPMIENQALSLGGAKGHKWVYRGESSQGEPKLFYRLYLTLPPSVGSRRLLVLEGLAPDAQSEQALVLFNGLARSLNWDRPSQ